MHRGTACVALAITAGVMSGTGAEMMNNSHIQALEVEYDDAVADSEIARGEVAQTYGNLQKFGELIGPDCLSVVETYSYMRNDGKLSDDETAEVIAVQEGQPCGEDKGEIFNYVTLLGLYEEAIDQAQVNFKTSLDTVSQKSNEVYASRLSKGEVGPKAFYIAYIGTLLVGLSFMLTKNHYAKIAQKDRSQIIEIH